MLEKEKPKTTGRTRIGKPIAISLPDSILEFIEAERKLSEDLVGAAPTQQTMIRTLLERARKSIELERSLELVKNSMKRTD